jgi:hypothetical protein
LGKEEAYLFLIAVLSSGWGSGRVKAGTNSINKFFVHGEDNQKTAMSELLKCKHLTEKKMKREIAAR